MPWLRALAVFALAATVWITWPLWQIRTTPPLLPVVPVPEISLGVPVLAACVATLLAPLPGIVAISALMAYGMFGDQTRMQPEFFSLPLLVWGTLPFPAARLLARVSLISLWFYSGLGKLLSDAYLNEAGPRMLGALPLPLTGALWSVSAVGVAIVEVSVALLALWPRTRHLAAWMVLFIHGGILLTLAANSAARNPAVWPWNLVLAWSGFAFISPWRSTLRSDWSAVKWAPRAMAGALALLPLGFYAGVVDAYPAHQLYSAGTARATVYCPRGCRPEQDINATWGAMQVPLPPQPRLFLGSFARTCGPGDALRIDDPRPPPWGSSREVFTCPAAPLPMAHP